MRPVTKRLEGVQRSLARHAPPHCNCCDGIDPATGAGVYRCRQSLYIDLEGGGRGLFYCFYCFRSISGVFKDTPTSEADGLYPVTGARPQATPW